MSMDPSLLRVEDLTVRFSRRGMPELTAVKAVNLELAQGEALGVVGESGSGKSTLARAIVSIQRLTSGTVEIDGHDLSRYKRVPLHLRRKVQMVFQDPASSLDPRQRVGSAVEEPLTVHSLLERSERKARVAEILQMVGLNEHHTARFPHELSGGQRQRVAIARALAVSPQLIVCDEAVSALDVSVQAQIINLLIKLQDQLGLGLIFIAHDLTVVRHLAHRVAVMHQGRIVETGPTAQVYDHPQHPYTMALLSAVLPAHPDDRLPDRIMLNTDVGELDEPTERTPIGGCAFRSSCWRWKENGEHAICATTEPQLDEISAHHLHACHFPTARAILPAGGQ